ncbi:hypothetical protein scyTo_0000770 [Scyliorhinus torazame]|uniref:CYTH domain-containing protein n=1 Tax=Scyliorhinus torazame TaxID=75743 RepID=A0A401P3T2_SCYTO|nr:hypothetical protein [Scyliorhinus torazame]
MQSVRIKQSYWFDEQTETRLQELGAVLVDEVIVKDHYYDNDTFDLAINQIWLSQRDTQWQLIIGLPKADGLTDANGDGEKQGEQGHRRASKPETRGNGGCQHVGSLISSGRNQCHPKLKSQNTKAQSFRHQDNENTTQDHQTPVSEQQDTRANDSETGDHAKAVPRYIHNELKSHRKIIEHIARFLDVSLTKEEESNMKINHFCQLAKIHHYASYHTTRRKTYELQDTYRIVIDRDEFVPRNVVVIYVNANVSNIIKELEKMEEIAAHLRISPCQTN